LHNKNYLIERKNTMKFKNVLLTSLSFVLVAAVAIGGTFAYLTSQDSDVNVMTMGNVKIEQHEYQRVVNADGTYATATIDNQTSYVLEEFKQAKPLLPIVGDPSSPAGYPYAGFDTTRVRMTQVNSYGSMEVFAGKNAQDKFVTVENTGKSDAFVRTLVAIEIGSTDGSLVGKSDRADTTHDGSLPWLLKNVGVIEIDGNNYALIEYLYLGAKLSNGSWRHEGGVLPAGDTTYPNLSQVYIGSEATNEDCEALDGNKNGTLDILVMSQAVQTAGFANAETALDTAFRDITSTNHPWTDGVKVPVIVTNDAELKAAIDEGAEEIVLESGKYGVIDVTVNRNLTLSAAANADVKIAGIDGQSNNNSTNVTIKGVTIDNSLQTEGWYTGTAQKIKPCVGVWGGNYTFENCTFYVTGESGAETGVMSWWTTNKGVMNFTNCTFDGGNNSARGMQIYGNYDLNVTNCTFNTAKDYSIKYVGAEGCVATFKNNNVNATTNFVQTGSAPYAGANYTLVFEGNTLATGINHVYVDNAEGQTITINGVVKAATNGAIY
jgi:predicted ribosomally synthesized peptide with SipW-like signal peptide